MKVNGTATLNASPEQVWAALNDPSVLVRTIPGCEQLETVGTDHYRMRVTAGVASIKGTYLGEVALADHMPYSAFTLKASGSGAPGTLSADVKVTLADPGDGTTVLSYDADAVVGGTIGGVGQRVLGGVARRLAGEFFQAVNTELTVPQAAAPTGIGSQEVAAAPPATLPEAPVPAAPSVFTRPSAPTQPGAVAAGSNPLAAAAVGALIALLGVLLGWRIARRG